MVLLLIWAMPARVSTSNKTPLTTHPINPAVLDAQARSFAHAPLKSGFIPDECLSLRRSPMLLDCWLQHPPHQKIAGAIHWDTHEAQPGVTIKPWSQWDAARRADLRDAFVAARQWHASGMTTWPGTVVDDPPPNMEGPWVYQNSKTVLDEQTAAWPLYIAHVAFTLAAEIDGWVPWSIRGYEADALSDLLSSYLKMFRYDSNNGDFYDVNYPGYVLVNTATPTHPSVTLKFLHDNDLVGATAFETVGRVLAWGENLSHFFGPFTIENYNAHWQYEGMPPVSRVLSGTLLLDPQYSEAFPTPRHWTAGCHGTSALLAWLLRPVNIPVGSRSTCFHATPYFSSLKRYLTHGDDPYTSGPDHSYPGAHLLVTENQFKNWFENVDPAVACGNLGRRPVDLAVLFPGDYLVGQHCSDVLSAKSHADSSVFAYFSSHYTVAQLEAAGLWEKLDAAIPTSPAPFCAPLNGQ